jgi:flagellar protein FliL
MAAKAEKKPEEAQQEGAPKKKKGLLLMIIGLVVLLAAGGGGAAFLMMSHKSDKKAKHAKVEEGGGGKEAEDGEEEADDEEGKDKKKAPVFFSMEPFVVNMAGDTQHYLQVGVELKLSKEEYAEKIKQHLPEIRNSVVLLLSSKQPDELASLEGKNRLRQEIRQSVNEPLGIRTSAKRKKPDEHPALQSELGEVKKEEKKDIPPKKGVVDVLLTSFVIQ